MRAVQVREFEQSDLDAVIEIVRGVGDVLGADACQIAVVDLLGARACVAVDEEARRPIGFAAYFVAEGIANLSWIVVERARQRRGVGRMLLGYLMGELGKRGVAELRVKMNASQMGHCEQTQVFLEAMGFLPLVEGETKKGMVLTRVLPPPPASFGGC